MDKTNLKDGSNMSCPLSYFFDRDVAEKRMASRKPAWVVHCEVSIGSFIEVDAGDADHARALAQNWVKNGAALSAAVRRVFPDGTLGAVIGSVES
jgi:hypothetical protein